MEIPGKLANKILNIARETKEKENKLIQEEQRQRRYLDVIHEKNPEKDELKNAVDEFLQETKIAKEVAENIFHISEGELYLNQLESDGKVSEHISEIERETESLDSLTEHLLEMVKELEQERNELEQLLKSNGVERDEKIQIAERRLKKTESMLESGIDNESNGFTRRDIIKGSAAAGFGGYWIGKLNNTQEPSRETKASKEIFEEYNDRLYQLTQKRGFSLNLPIAIGERHAPPGDSFSTLNRLLRNYDVSKLGLEFLHYGSEAVRKFNQESISPEEFAQIYINRGRWPRIKSQVVEVFRYAQNNRIEIVGLEHKPVSTQQEFSENYSDQLERSKAMVEIVKEVNDGKSIFLAGNAHVDRRMSVTTQLVKNAHPEIATKIEPNTAVRNPYVYTEFKDKTGVPNEESFGSSEDNKIMYSGYVDYTFVGAIDSITSVCSTHPKSELHKLNKSGLEYLKASKITEMNGIKEEIEKAKKIINNMNSGKGYKTVSSSGYGVFMEPNTKETSTQPNY